VTFGEVSTGAQNDLQRAAEIARRMVKEYGMSDRLGALAFEPERRPIFLPGTDGLTGGAPYSEETAREIDQEVKRIIDETANRVTTILRRGNGHLRAIAEQLLAKEVLEGDALRQILGSRAAG
jgi:cell division protease FtsH